MHQALKFCSHELLLCFNKFDDDGTTSRAKSAPARKLVPERPQSATEIRSAHTTNHEDLRRGPTFNFNERECRAGLTFDIPDPRDRKSPGILTSRRNKGRDKPGPKWLLRAKNQGGDILTTEQ
jgi:hypothetical protein